MTSDKQTSFRAVTVGRRGLELLRPLVEEFVATGNSQWDTEGLLKVAWQRLGTPLFRVWTVVRQGTSEPLGFIAAQVQAAETGMELYLLAAYVAPGEPLETGWPVMEAALRWGRLMGCERAMVRTVRGDSDGLDEPRAWERLGFRYESTLLVHDMNESRVAEESEPEELEQEPPMEEQEDGQRGT